jgi:hypothetical protein
VKFLKATSNSQTDFCLATQYNLQKMDLFPSPDLEIRSSPFMCAEQETKRKSYLHTEQYTHNTKSNGHPVLFKDETGGVYMTAEVPSKFRTQITWSLTLRSLHPVTAR